MRIARFLVFALCLAIPLGAYAQSGAGTDAAQRESDPVWLLYDQAFERLAAGDVETARVLLDTLRAQFPDHPAAEQAARRLAEKPAVVVPGPAGDSAGLPEAQAEAQVSPGGREQTSKFARGELALMMTLHGVLTAQLTCTLFDCSGTRARAASVMAGGGAGLGLSLYLSRHGVTPGQALLMNSAMTWGAWNGAGFVGFNDSNSDAGAVILGQAVGLGLGLGVWHTWHPTAGEVAMANTTGFWSSILVLMFHGLADSEPKIETIVVAGDLGLALGGFLGSQLEHISRGRTLIIDAGGILGFLTGGLLAVIARPDSEEGVFAPLILGTVTGLGVAAYATRHWDVPALPNNAALSLAPMGQNGWGATVFWQWQ